MTPKKHGRHQWLSENDHKCDFNQHFKSVIAQNYKTQLCSSYLTCYCLCFVPLIVYIYISTNQEYSKLDSYINYQLRKLGNYLMHEFQPMCGRGRKLNFICIWYVRISIYHTFKKSMSNS